MFQKIRMVKKTKYTFKRGEKTTGNCGWTDRNRANVIDLVSVITHLNYNLMNGG